MTTYQGHLNDGSSIQKHSAGGLYPFVVQHRQTEQGIRFELIGPGIDTALRFQSYDDCIAAGERLLAVRDNADAWAFELEALEHVAYQRIAPMIRATERLAAFPDTFADMSKVARVWVLLQLGAVRNTLRIPPGCSRPHFAAYAAARV